MAIKTNLKVSILIPTYNAGELWYTVLDSIGRQDFVFHKKLIIDSGSKDQTIALAAQSSFEVGEIPQSKFNHGATRQLLVDKAEESDIVVFLTQDAVLSSTNSIKHLIRVFDNPEVGMAYGRQLPHKNARLLETHARLFNYPATSVIRGYSDKDKVGFKVFFCSNSFAAYRLSALKDAGWFPSGSIMGEDALVAAQILLKNYKIAYVADAAVYHSHSYTPMEELKRYFDTRVFHEQNKWLIENYGKPTGEGVKYVKSELQYVMQKKPIAVLDVAFSILAKWIGYTAGKYYKLMPISILRRFSMHTSYWKE